MKNYFLLAEILLSAPLLQTSQIINRHIELEPQQERVL